MILTLSVSTNITIIRAKARRFSGQNEAAFSHDAPAVPSRLDLREGGDKKEFVDHDVRGRVRSDLSGSFLTFDPLVGSDTGIYKCRVDFENSPTLAALVNLTVYGKDML